MRFKPSSRARCASSHSGKSWIRQPSAAAAYEADLMEKLTGVGHGLGLGFELPWIDTASPWTLAAGMTIALEVYLSEPGVGTVAFEHVVLVTDGKPEILTLGCPSRWW